MLNKPIYVGFTVLDLSKCMTSITTLLKKKIDAELLFTDTDSLAYEINQKMLMRSFF